LDSAPLYATKEAPVPGGGAAEWYVGAKGLTLRAALFPALVEPAAGTVICSPGRAEPLEKYFEVVDDLRQRGYCVLLQDWRGQGLSGRLLPDRLKGHAENVSDFLVDYSLLLDHFEDRLPRPWIGMGHSMGGCLTLSAAAKGEHRLDGVILSAPMLGIKVAAMSPLVMQTLAFVGSRIAPSGSPTGPAKDPANETFPADALTHDEPRYRRFQQQLIQHPDLRLGSVTWGWMGFALKACGWLATARDLEQIDIPVTAVLAGEDQLIDLDASMKTLSRIPGVEIVRVEGAWHEILIEQDPLRAQFFEAFDRLSGRINAQLA
jgi:lysophospholipase